MTTRVAARARRPSRCFVTLRAAAFAFLGMAALTASAQTFEYQYRQTGPDAVVLEGILFRITVIVTSSFPSPATPIATTAAANLVGPNGPQALEKGTIINGTTPGQSSSVVFMKRFTTIEALRALLPDGSYYVTFSGFGAANPTPVVFPLTVAVPPTPRITNYESLQNWNSDELTVSWTPAASFAQNSEIRLIEASGRVAMYIPITAADSGTMTYTPVRADPGTTLSVEFGPPVPSSSIIILGRPSPTPGSAQTLLRFSIHRASLTPPGNPPTITAPAIATHPAGTTVLNGAKAVFTASATGSDLTYQWKRDGAPIAGATAATLTLESATFAEAGDYTVTVTNSAGSATSNAARLTVAAVTRLANVSLLTSLDESGASFTLGYVVGGAGTGGQKPLVIRAAGPSLGALGVGGTLESPRLELFRGTARTGENSGWGGDTRLRDAMAAVGAFAFTGPQSRDAAALASVSAGDNSVKVSSATAETGLVIAEIYDATPGALFTASTPRLLNVSVLKPLGTGVTVGFVVSGDASKGVLIRAIGPTLGTVFGLDGAAADPQVTLFNSSHAIVAENNDWGGTTALTAAFASVGAFALPADSRDAALTATLPPGNYTVEVKGVGERTGIALIEVYELP